MTLPVAPEQPMTGQGHSLPWNSVWLLSAKASQMGLAFLFWVVAARTASVPEVGVAAASVSAVILSTQLGILGAGSAVIIALGEGQDRRRVLDTAFSTVAVASLVAAGGYLLFTGLVAGGALSSTRTAPFAVVFLTAALLGTVLMCLDQASIALQHTEGAAVRYTLAGALALVAVLGAAAAGRPMTATLLLTCWTAGSAAALLLGVVQLRRWVGYRFRFRLRPRRVRALLRLGVPNHLLTLSERLPAVLVPIVLAHVVSAEAVAYWYPAWMMAWLALTAPVSVGMIQFADVVRRPDAVVGTIRQGLLWSTLLGGAIFLVLGVGADFFLTMLGESYADASVTALRLLSLGLVAFIALQAYNAYCRAAGRTAEATAVGVLVVVAVTAGTALAGAAGTAAVALVWVGSVSAGALVAVVRLRRLLRVGGER